MSDEQLIVLAAATLMSAHQTIGEKDWENAVLDARGLYAINKKLGPLPTQALPETRKATLSHPTIQERNEAHAERQYEKRRG